MTELNPDLYIWALTWFDFSLELPLCTLALRLLLLLLPLRLLALLLVEKSSRLGSAKSRGSSSSSDSLKDLA